MSEAMKTAEAIANMSLLSMVVAMEKRTDLESSKLPSSLISYNSRRVGTLEKLIPNAKSAIDVVDGA